MYVRKSTDGSADQTQIVTVKEIYLRLHVRHRNTSSLEQTSHRARKYASTAAKYNYKVDWYFFYASL